METIPTFNNIENKRAELRHARQVASDLSEQLHQLQADLQRAESLAADAEIKFYQRGCQRPCFGTVGKRRAGRGIRERLRLSPGGGMKPIYDELYFHNEASFLDACHHITEAIEAIRKIKTRSSGDEFMKCHKVAVDLGRQIRALESARVVLAPKPSNPEEMRDRNQAMLDVCKRQEEETKIYSGNVFSPECGPGR